MKKYLNSHFLHVTKKKDLKQQANAQICNLNRPISQITRIACVVCLVVCFSLLIYNAFAYGQEKAEEQNQTQIQTEIQARTDETISAQTDSVTNQNSAAASTIDFNDSYLTFTAQAENSSVTFKYESGSNVQYKIGGGSWTNCKEAKNETGDIINLTTVGSTVSFKGNNVHTSEDYHFSMSGSIDASGDVTSLIN